MKSLGSQVTNPDSATDFTDGESASVSEPGNAPTTKGLTGQEVREARIAKRIKQIELAQLAGIERSRLNQFENGWIKKLRPQEEEALRRELGMDSPTVP